MIRLNLCALASLREISKRVESGRQQPEDGGQMAEIIAMDADPPWKDILERYFVRFIEFFFGLDHRFGHLLCNCLK